MAASGPTLHGSGPQQSGQEAIHTLLARLSELSVRQQSLVTTFDHLRSVVEKVVERFSRFAFLMAMGGGARNLLPYGLHSVFSHHSEGATNSSHRGGGGTSSGSGAFQGFAKALEEYAQYMAAKTDLRTRGDLITQLRRARMMGGNPISDEDVQAVSGGSIDSLQKLVLEAQDQGGNAKYKALLDEKLALYKQFLQAKQDAYEQISKKGEEKKTDYSAKLEEYRQYIAQRQAIYESSMKTKGEMARERAINEAVSLGLKEAMKASNVDLRKAVEKILEGEGNSGAINQVMGKLLGAVSEKAVTATRAIISGANSGGGNSPAATKKALKGIDPDRKVFAVDSETVGTEDDKDPVSLSAAGRVGGKIVTATMWADMPKRFQEALADLREGKDIDKDRKNALLGTAKVLGFKGPDAVRDFLEAWEKGLELDKEVGARERFAQVVAEFIVAGLVPTGHNLPFDTPVFKQILGNANFPDGGLDTHKTHGGSLDALIDRVEAALGGGAVKKLLLEGGVPASVANQLDNRKEAHGSEIDSLIQLAVVELLQQLKAGVAEEAAPAPTRAEEAASIGENLEMVGGPDGVKRLAFPGGESPAPAGGGGDLDRVIDEYLEVERARREAGEDFPGTEEWIEKLDSAREAVKKAFMEVHGHSEGDAELYANWLLNEGVGGGERFDAVRAALSGRRSPPPPAGSSDWEAESSAEDQAAYDRAYEEAYLKGAEGPADGVSKALEELLRHNPVFRAYQRALFEHEGGGRQMSQEEQDAWQARLAAEGERLLKEAEKAADREERASRPPVEIVIDRQEMAGELSRHSGAGRRDRRDSDVDPEEEAEKLGQAAKLARVPLALFGKVTKKEAAERQKQFQEALARKGYLGYAADKIRPVMGAGVNLASQSLSAGNPVAFQTLMDSFTLLGGRLSTFLLPAVVSVAQGAQDWANWLATASPAMKGWLGWGVKWAALGGALVIATSAVYNVMAPLGSAFMFLTRQVTMAATKLGGFQNIGSTMLMGGIATAVAGAMMYASSSLSSKAEANAEQREREEQNQTNNIRKKDIEEVTGESIIQGMIARGDVAGLKAKQQALMNTYLRDLKHDSGNLSGAQSSNSFVSGWYGSRKQRANPEDYKQANILAGIIGRMEQRLPQTGLLTGAKSKDGLTQADKADQVKAAREKLQSIEKDKHMLLSLRAMAASPQYSEVANAYKKVQLDVLSKDPMLLAIEKMHREGLLELLRLTQGMSEEQKAQTAAMGRLMGVETSAR